MKYRQPSPLMLERITKLRLRGWSNRAIGAQYKVHETTVIGWVRKYGLDGRRPAGSKTKEQCVAEASELRNEGQTLEAISYTLGIPATTLSNWFHSADDSVLNARRAFRQEIAARLAEIPPDTRDLTSRTFGDPLPGRRAIDKRVAR